MGYDPAHDGVTLPSIICVGRAGSYSLIPSAVEGVNGIGDSDERVGCGDDDTDSRQSTSTAHLTTRLPHHTSLREYGCFGRIEFTLIPAHPTPQQLPVSMYKHNHTFRSHIRALVIHPPNGQANRYYCVEPLVSLPEADLITTY